MISRLIELALNLFTINRWNTSPHVERITDADNAGFSLHVALLLAHICNESTGVANQVDNEKLIKRIVLKDLPKAILSDISLNTKEYIKTTSLELWQKTFSSALEEVLVDVPEKWRSDFRDKIENAKDESTEGVIISFSDAYSAWLECEFNSRVFPEYYARPLRESTEKLERFRGYPFINDLLSSDNLKNYLLQVRTLINSVRWNQVNRNIRTTVAGHTFFVTFIATLFSYIADSEWNGSGSYEQMLLKSAFHDIPEALTGDIISPTKRRIPGFEDIVTEVEEQMVDEYLISLLPGDSSRMKAFMLQPFTGDKGNLVRAADLFGSLFECQMEIISGNRNLLFKRAYNDIMREIKQMDIPEADYLLKWGFDQQYA
ncbi:MAG TPA: HD domain-containing protein [Thermotogota bacterium]|nr:HD domain-containing protein [Thermotogota bacterium]HPJ88269.1 HD domain-containing protein [Thermotogota bacterium]HPR96745.1 HD domain-containing protein [Thermotogota bacterium]